MRQPRDTPWALPLLRSCASLLGGAGVAALLVELFNRRQWDMILVAVASMAVAFQAYMAHAERLHAALRRYAILDSIDEGVAVLALDGTVTFWNGALERLTRCPRERAIGFSLLQAAPDVRHTRLAQIIQEAVAHRTPQTNSRVSWATPEGPRVLDVTVLVEPSGVTLLWHDATDQANADLARKHAEERLVLVSEGATDGLWEWDLRTHVLRLLAGTPSWVARRGHLQLCRLVARPRPPRRPRRGSKRLTRIWLATANPSSTNIATRSGAYRVAQSRTALRPLPAGLADRRILHDTEQVTANEARQTRPA
jgi:PAS domain-containing protein